MRVGCRRANDWPRRTKSLKLPVLIVSATPAACDAALPDISAGDGKVAVEFLGRATDGAGGLPT